MSCGYLVACIFGPHRTHLFGYSTPRALPGLLPGQFRFRGPARPGFTSTVDGRSGPVTPIERTPSTLGGSAGPPWRTLATAKRDGTAHPPPPPPRPAGVGGQPATVVGPAAVIDTVPAGRRPAARAGPTTVDPAATERGSTPFDDRRSGASGRATANSLPLKDKSPNPDIIRRHWAERVDLHGGKTAERSAHATVGSTRFTLMAHLVVDVLGALPATVALPRAEGQGRGGFSPDTHRRDYPPRIRRSSIRRHARWRFST